MLFSQPEPRPPWVGLVSFPARFLRIGPIRATFASSDSDQKKECRMPLRMRVHDREPIGLALRRFKKLLERSGIQKELRKRKYSETHREPGRRPELRKQSAIRKAKNLASKGKG